MCSGGDLPVRLMRTVAMQRNIAALFPPLELIRGGFDGPKNGNQM
jgi:hypothetical protein